MKTEFLIGAGLVLCSNAVAAISQVLLKTAAGKHYETWWRAYINPRVILAYALFFGTTICGVIALRYIPLSLSAAFEAAGQIFVPVLSAIVLKEHIGKRKLRGMVLIVIGIILFSL